MLDDWDGFCFGIEIWRVDVKVKELGSNFYPKKKKILVHRFFSDFCAEFLQNVFRWFRANSGRCGMWETRKEGKKKKGLKKKAFCSKIKREKKWKNTRSVNKSVPTVARFRPSETTTTTTTATTTTTTATTTKRVLSKEMRFILFGCWEHEFHGWSAQSAATFDRRGFPFPPFFLNLREFFFSLILLSLAGNTKPERDKRVGSFGFFFSLSRITSIHQIAFMITFFF